MRAAGWESRLAAVVLEARKRAFDPKRWNCARFAHEAAQAVAGQALPYRWHGSLEASADAALPRINPKRALCGDIVMADVPLPTLGVCIGRKAAFVSVSGLIYFPMRKARIAWSV